MIQGFLVPSLPVSWRTPEFGQRPKFRRFNWMLGACSWQLLPQPKLNPTVLLCILSPAQTLRTMVLCVLCVFSIGL